MTTEQAAEVVRHLAAIHDDMYFLCVMLMIFIVLYAWIKFLEMLIK